MDWSELEALLDKLEDTRRPAEITNAIRKAKRAVYFDGNFGAYIRMIILKDAGVQPKLSVVPSSKRIPLAPLLEAGYEWGNKGAFNHRNDLDLIDKMLDFCDPYSKKRKQYLDEMSPGQETIIEMISEDVRRAKRMADKSIDIPEDILHEDDGTIEEALNNAIKAKVREKGSDTPKR